MRGVVPIGVTAPRGATSVMLSPARSDSCSARRRPIATPCAWSKPSSVPCLMLLATEVSLSRSLARDAAHQHAGGVERRRRQRLSLDDRRREADARQAWRRGRATASQSVSGDPSGCTSRWPLRPRILSSSSLRNPFITAITMIERRDAEHDAEEGEAGDDRDESFPAPRAQIAQREHPSRTARTDGCRTAVASTCGPHGCRVSHDSGGFKPPKSSSNAARTA